MSNLSMVEATLPPGFRFHPRDDELICDYLFNKLSFTDSHLLRLLLLEIDLNKCEPWDLPETACVGGKEWYFYSQRDRKYATGLRTNRATVSGYWKATGKDRSIFRNRALVGMRKTLVFYLGRAPKGKKTDWVMHEFRLHGLLAPPFDPSVKEDWVLCRVFCKKREIVDENAGNISKYEDTGSCSSSLPPLMEPNYTISFDQSQPTTNFSINNNRSTYNQQVPCFSTIFNMSHNPQIDPLMSNNQNLLISINTCSTTTIPQPPLPDIAIPSTSSSSSHCYEKKGTIKAILSRFDNMDKNDTLSFSEGLSDQSFLSDEALAVTMWYP